MSAQIELLTMKDDAPASDSDEVCPDRYEGTVNNSEVPTTEQKYKSYHRRWYMLLSLAVLSFSNGMVIHLDYCIYNNLNISCLDVVDICSYYRSDSRFL